MDRLLITGFTVLLETSGERLLGKVPALVVKIVDVKCPHSGEGGIFRHDNLLYLTGRDEVKFVLASRGDYEFAREFILKHELSARVGSVILSPASRTMQTSSQAPNRVIGEIARMRSSSTGSISTGRRRAAVPRCAGVIPLPLGRRWSKRRLPELSDRLMVC